MAASGSDTVSVAERTLISGGIVAVYFLGRCIRLGEEAIMLGPPERFY
jgi:hypothetical protein